MSAFETPDTLRTSVRDGRSELVRLYGPVVYALARTRGMGDDAAAGLVRDVLTRSFRSDWRWPDGSGRESFHSRVAAIARGTLAADRAADFDAAWEYEFRRRLVLTAMGRLEHEFPPPVWEAFRLTAVNGQSAVAAARDLGTTPGAVLVAKCRVLARLRDAVHRLGLEADTSAGVTPDASDPSRTRAWQTDSTPDRTWREDVDGERRCRAATEVAAAGRCW